MEGLQTDERGVTPVIGIIMLVSIAVILSSVVAVFVFDIGMKTQDPGPAVNFEFDYTEGVTGASCTLSSEDGELEIVFEAGKTIEEDRLSLKDTNNGEITNIAGCDGLNEDSELKAGVSFTVGVAADETTKIIWTSKEGDTTAVVGEFDGPKV